MASPHSTHISIFQKDTKDYSSYVSMEVARDLILYMARPGQYDQISDLVTDQDSNERLMQQLVLDMHAVPNKDYSVDQMADRCHMSVRTFTREFKESFANTSGIGVLYTLTCVSC